jgi:hypothetical protein
MLRISSETVCYIIFRARELDVIEEGLTQMGGGCQEYELRRL